MSEETQQKQNEGYPEYDGSFLVNNDNDFQQYIQNLTLKGGEDIVQFDQLNIQNDISEFKKLREDLDQPDPIDFNDKIFKQLVTDAELKQYCDNPQCHICSFTFTLTKRRHQCRFCAQAVCGDHSKQSREDPKKAGQGTNDFHRICDSCAEKYLWRAIIMQRQAQQEQYDFIREKLEKQLNDVKEQKFDRLQTLEKIHNQKNQDNSSVENSNYAQKISQIRSQLQSLTTEYNDQKDASNQIDQEIQKIEKTLDEQRKIIQEKQKQEKELANQITAIDEDIQQVQATIEEVERRIKENFEQKEDQKEVNFSISERSDLGFPQNSQQEVYTPNVINNKDQQQKNENGVCQTCSIF